MVFNCFSFFPLEADSVSLGPALKLTFSIRPRSLTGVLIHIGSQSGQHLSVYMEAGKVCSRMLTWEGRGSQSPLTETNQSEDRHRQSPVLYL